MGVSGGNIIAARETIAEVVVVDHVDKVPVAVTM
jgi:hypothetical protein